MTIEPWVPVFYEVDSVGIQDWITIGVGFGGAVIGALVGGWISSRQAKDERKANDLRDALDRIEIKRIWSEPNFKRR